MPELPEVEATRLLLVKHARGHIVVDVIGGRDDKLFEGASEADVRGAFVGRRVEEARRLGKQFWLELSGGGATPVMHLGMTGQIWVKLEDGSVDAVAYVRDVGNGKTGKNGEDEDEEGEPAPAAAAAPWPPRFCKIELALSSGARVAFCDARRFARVRLVPAGADPLAVPPLSRLGFDPVLSMPPLARFRELLARRRGGKLKALLLDQGFSAGVGNWVADEVLWQARLHPEQGVGALLDADADSDGDGDEEGGAVARLHKSLRGVCETACEFEADSGRYPDDWLFTHRWTGGKSTTMPDGGGGGGKGGGHHRIEFVTAGGRTSAYVPALQKMIGGGGGGGAAGGKAGGGGGRGGKKPKAAAASGKKEEEAEDDAAKAGGGKKPKKEVEDGAGASKKPVAAKASGKKEKKEEEAEAAAEATAGGSKTQKAQMASGKRQKEAEAGSDEEEKAKVRRISGGGAAPAPPFRPPPAAHRSPPTPLLAPLLPPRRQTLPADRGGPSAPPPLARCRYAAMRSGPGGFLPRPLPARPGLAAAAAGIAAAAAAARGLVAVLPRAFSFRLDSRTRTRNAY